MPIFHPAIDVYEIDGYLIVEAALPSARCEDIDLRYEPGLLWLTGSVGEFSGTRTKWHRREIAIGRFAERIQLPIPVAAEQAVAAISEGLLTILLPTSDRATECPVKIRVESASQPDQPER